MNSEKFITELEEAERTGEVTDFLQEREQHLSAETSPIIFAAGQRVTYQYIHPESTVKASGFSKGFCLDDPRAHETFAKATLNVAKNNYGESADTLIVLASQLAVMKYMGIASSGDEKLRNKLLGGLFRGNRRSIAEMAASGASMCMERASVTHNMCLLAGVPSVLLSGRVKLDGEKKDAGHAFQIIKNEDTNNIYDSTNPSFDTRSDSLSIVPTLEPVNALELLTGTATKDTKIVYPSGEKAIVRTVTYSHRPDYPTTFEGFDELRFAERAAISELHESRYRQLAIEESVQNLEASRLAVDYLPSD